MTKEERLLKQAKASVESASHILSDTTADTIDVQAIRAAGNQALQAASELFELLGMVS